MPEQPLIPTDAMVRQGLIVLVRRISPEIDPSTAVETINEIWEAMSTCHHHDAPAGRIETAEDAADFAGARHERRVPRMQAGDYTSRPPLGERPERFSVAQADVGAIERMVRKAEITGGVAPADLEQALYLRDRVLAIDKFHEIFDGWNGAIHLAIGSYECDIDETAHRHLQTALATQRAMLVHALRMMKVEIE